MQNGDRYAVVLSSLYKKKCPIKLPKDYVPKVGHGPKMGQNEFELVEHGSIGLLQAQFKKKERTGTSSV